MTSEKLPFEWTFRTGWFGKLILQRREWTDYTKTYWLLRDATTADLVDYFSYVHSSRVAPPPKRL